MQFYMDETREQDAWALPDAEVFYRTEAENAEYGFVDSDGDPMPTGWYWWACFPGCMPESEPYGPFIAPELAIIDARDQY